MNETNVEVSQNSLVTPTGNCEDLNSQNKRFLRKKRKIKFDNEDQISVSGIDSPDEDNISKSKRKECPGISLKKRKGKFSQTYIVPSRYKFKSASLIISIVEKIILKCDPLQLLRSCRQRLQEFEGYNDLSSKRVTRVLNKNSRIYCSDYLKGNITIPKNTEPDIPIAREINQEDMFIEIKCNHESEGSFPIDNTVQISKSDCENVQRANEKFTNTWEHFHLLPKLLCEEYQRILQTEYENKIISTENVTNIDILQYKAKCNYYRDMHLLFADLNFLFDYLRNNIDKLFNIQLSQTEQENCKKYLSNVYYEFVGNFMEVSKEFRLLFDNDIKAAIEQNKLPKTNCTCNNPPVNKKYTVITDYYHIMPEITNPKTKTSLTPQCDGTCCTRFEDLGPLTLENGSWDSKCADRHNNLECDPAYCNCNNETCKNQAIAQNNHKKLGEDVEERYAWGIDLYTYRNLLEFLPLNFSDEFKGKNFIEKILMVTLSKLGTYGWSIPKACEQIQSNPLSTDVEKYFAQHLLMVYQTSKTALNLSSKAFSKGIGIFCKKRVGIKRNEFISGYLGEIYPPWLWFEKQDIIKKEKLDKELPDFYNIMLERLKRDDRGYDLVMVDPNSMGNFASRMSHSCIPNCSTVLMVYQQQYTIGMFATKEIKFDEELTFDYNSVTEKEKEYQDAVCLCSSFDCRGHYLILAKSMLFTEVIGKFHTFLHRNAILLEASSNTNDLTKEDLILLDKYSIRSSILEDTPLWLKKWTTFVLRYLDLEANLLPRMLYKIEKAGIKLVKARPSRTNMKVLSDNEKKDNEDKNEKIKCNEEKKNEEVDEKKANIEKKKLFITERPKKFDFNDYYLFYERKPIPKRRKIVSLFKVINDTSANFLNNDIVIKKDVLAEVNPSIINETLMKLQNKFNAEQLSQNGNAKTTKANNLKTSNNELPIKANPSNNSNSKQTKNHISSEIISKKSTLHNITYTKEDLEVLIEIKDEEDQKLFDSIKFQVTGVIDNRIQNLAITIDKIKHVLSLIKTDQPPLIKLTEKEIYDFYWGDKKNSLRASLEENIESLLRNEGLPKSLLESLKQIFSQVKLDKNANCSQENYSLLNKTIRGILEDLSWQVRRCKNIDTSNKLVFYEGLADCLYLYANTQVFFRLNKTYEKANANSLKVQIRKRDINLSLLGPNENIDELNLDEVIREGIKEYEKLYVWGQLVGWFKQTVDKPNASLSAERRGTLSYPEIDSFFVKRHSLSNSDKIFSFPFGNRKTFYTKLIENPSLMWPIGNEWSFKNRNKIYGTVQFDSVLFSQNLNQIKEYLFNVIQNM